MIKTVTAVVLSLIVCSFGCSEDIAGLEEVTIYQNSFETNEETERLVHDAVRIYYEGCPVGGTRSLRVSGGCVVPHFGLSVDISERTDEVRRFRFNLYGYTKDSPGGGFVKLYRVDSDGKIHAEPVVNFYIKGTDWTYYESDPFVVNNSESIHIYGICGGLYPVDSPGPSYMLIDMLTITEIK